VSPGNDRGRAATLERVDVDTATRSWAWRRLLPHVAAAPSYGSLEWVGLPDDRPEKIAAVVLAAECWRHQAGRWAELSAEQRRALGRLTEVELAEAIGTFKGAVSKVAERLAGTDPYEALRALRQTETTRKSSGYPGRAGGVHGVDWVTGAWLDAEGHVVPRVAA